MEPLPRSPEGPSAEDKLELTREALAGSSSRRGVELRPLLNWLSLALALVLATVAGSVGIQRLRSHPTTSAATSTPASTLFAGQGWTSVGPLWAQQIVFAPSQPRTAYICGTPANSNSNRQAPVTLGISRDAGHTWQTTPTQILATQCQINVDPTNAHDVLLQVEHCITCTTQLPAQLYRSGDGGQSWYLITLPSLAGSSSTSFTAYQLAWQGSTLFVSPYPSGISVAGTASQGIVAISLAQGPFTWLNTKALQAGVPSSLQLNTVYATSSAVYADFTGPSGCTGACEVVKRSADLGLTWSIFAPHFRGHPVYLLDQTVSIADGRTLVGQVFTTLDETTRIYVSSSDGGLTWAPLPSLPGRLLISVLASTPSGILYAQTWTPSVPTAVQAVYRLALGARGWTLVGAMPASPFPFIVAWDEQGNPLALWSVTWSGASQSAQQIAAGLTTHAP